MIQLAMGTVTIIYSRVRSSVPTCQENDYYGASYFSDENNLLVIHRVLQLRGKSMIPQADAHTMHLDAGNSKL